MSGNLKQIKTKIKSLKSTTKITKAMNLVASSKFKTAKKNLAIANEKYIEINNINQKVFTGDELSSSIIVNNLLQKYSNSKNVLIVVISPDKGLCGSINTYIKKEFHVIISKLRDLYNLTICSIGNKIKEDVNAKYIFLNSIEEDDILNFANTNMLNKIYILYTHFYSSIKFEVKTIEVKIEVGDESSGNVIIEPSITETQKISAMLFLLSAINLAKKHSFASEQSSRMIAMDNSTKNATKMISTLTLEANKVRQAIITRDLIDIISGSESIKS